MDGLFNIMLGAFPRNEPELTDTKDSINDMVNEISDCIGEKPFYIHTSPDETIHQSAGYLTLHLNENKKTIRNNEIVINQRLEFNDEKLSFTDMDLPMKLFSQYEESDGYLLMITRAPLAIRFSSFILQKKFDHILDNPNYTTSNFINNQNNRKRTPEKIGFMYINIKTGKYHSFKK